MIPPQFLAVLVAVAVDNLLTPALSQYPARFVPVSFQSFNDACDMSEWLWANVNREKHCALCRKNFEYNDVFSVALDSESKIKFLHRVCADTNGHGLRMLIEGYQYPDTMHYLSVRWRGMPERAVIGAIEAQMTSDQMLQAQKRAQDMAEVRVLEAELERRRALRAAAVIQ